MRRSEPADELRETSPSRKVGRSKVTEARKSSMCAEKDKQLGVAGVKHEVQEMRTQREAGARPPKTFCTKTPEHGEPLKVLEQGR